MTRIGRREGPRHPIAEHRKRRGWSQVELANRAGLSAPHLCRIETGLQAPKPVTMHAIAHALGVTPEELTRGPATETDPTPKEEMAVAAIKGHDPVYPQMPGTWYGGQTTREWYAGLALQGLAATYTLTAGPDADHFIGEMVSHAVKIADAMIRALNGGRADLSANGRIPDDTVDLAGEAAAQDAQDPTRDVRKGEPMSIRDERVELDPFRVADPFLPPPVC
jgi:transcriptional regulator with XRE-family HTH domain